MRQVRLALLLVPLCFAFVSAQTPPQGPPQGPPPNPAGGQMPPGPPGGGPPQERWKPEKLTNLKVLPKDTTPDQIMELMQHFRRSLNTGCWGCPKGQKGQPISSFDFPDDSKENKEV